MPHTPEVSLLGGVFSWGTSPDRVFEHRSAQAWRAYWSRAESFSCRSASVRSRLFLLQRTVLPVFLHTLECVAPVAHLVKKIAKQHARMVSMIRGLRKSSAESFEALCEKA